jgi:hypothetical protein
VIVKILYAILVLSTIAVVGVAIAIYWRVRRHLSPPDQSQTRPLPPVTQEATDQRSSEPLKLE